MRVVLSLLALFASLTFAGCALFQSAPLAKNQLVTCANSNATVTETCNHAVDVLEKANVLLASVNDTIDSNYLAKTLTKDQALAYRARTKEADAQIDKALDLLTSAQFGDALSQANVTKALIEALDREIAAQLAAQAAKGNT